jgi:hypothetical protein
MGLNGGFFGGGLEQILKSTATASRVLSDRVTHFCLSHQRPPFTITYSFSFSSRRQLAGRADRISHVLPAYITISDFQ